MLWPRDPDRFRSACVQSPGVAAGASNACASQRLWAPSGFLWIPHAKRSLPESGQRLQLEIGPKTPPVIQKKPSQPVLPREGPPKPSLESTRPQGPRWHHPGQDWGSALCPRTTGCGRQAAGVLNTEADLSLIALRACA